MKRNFVLAGRELGEAGLERAAERRACQIVWELSYEYESQCAAFRVAAGVRSQYVRVQWLMDGHVADPMRHHECMCAHIQAYMLV